MISPLLDFALTEAILDDRADLWPADPVPIKSPGWRDATRVYWPQPTWHDIHPANQATQAARKLGDLGVLVSGDGKDLTCNPPRSIARSIGFRKRVYVLHAAMVLEEAANLPPSTDSAPAIASGA